MHSIRALASRTAAAAATRATVSRRAMHSTPARLVLTAMKMPSLSPTMESGGIAQWKKKPGESFAAGDVLLEIETDKATMDVEAQEDGILAKVVVNDGAKEVKVGSVIAVIGEEGDDLSGADKVAEDASASSSGSSSPKAESKKEDSKPESKQDSAPKQQDDAAQKESTSQSQPSSSSSSSADAGNDGPIERVFASPLAKKLAQERGIPLLKVKGTGPNGRITKTDIENYKSDGASKAGSASSPSASASSTSSASAYTDIPTSSMRRVIAQRLTESKQQLPHYYVSIDIEMDRVLALRALFNSAAEQKAGKDAAKAKASKLSVGDFITKAAAVALREVPEVNSAWYGDFIRQHHKVDISIAVATPTGLITPIVRDVGGNGLTAISASTKELASRARDGKLKPEEYQGGTFTISNMGMFGVSSFTAVINPPQGAILAIGGTEAKILPAKEGGDEVEAAQGFRKAQVMTATISADHRVIDGATAARWMKAFKDTLENPLSFML
ncbi:unnamed protein product [Tilletia controversa]|uniref:Acetyltransferase component of pyruvate dehydrogenase complex n=3 Tax=Tilletia TaxID=13289 RepID=A0A8X7T0S2_9BASI|nr:hypothetical protein CF336_g894 [Tilletia laevis]KAE8205826.1 hypothetical protein CF328_g260 [Tilletia controversa]KAE8264763.1 hypothetical protein A4X03_0g725 [Tilletia caries]KAE8208278.1 hypothetical protein CF335_g531 [Tilletia laevis]KAE8254647.1 hypothetical protein A4X06_0g806 [Tilletia controversa]